MLLSLALGFATGLRCFTAPAAASWAAHLGWLNLQASPLAFMSSTTAVAIASFMAVGEYFADQYPKTPSRVSPGALIGRIVCGGLAGACLCTSAGKSLIAGALLGAVGGVLGAVTGYQVRGRLVQDHKVRDVYVGLPESAFALGLAWICVRLAA